MMDILMYETCWIRKKWNKIASDIKLVFYSSTITMLHGPINISNNFTYVYQWVQICSWKQMHITLWSLNVNEEEPLSIPKSRDRILLKRILKSHTAKELNGNADRGQFKDKCLNFPVNSVNYSQYYPNFTEIRTRYVSNSTVRSLRKNNAVNGARTCLKSSKRC